MNLNDIESKINELFDNSSNRQIIFWYDENKEFISYRTLFAIIRICHFYF